ncbi:Rhodanese-like domain-containing protein [Xylariomycetidae sp. FL2044]|nr:Rhodanese-like domain-containing protein [Xylariomycetidae sp. FL2044]
MATRRLITTTASPFAALSRSWWCVTRTTTKASARPTITAPAAVTTARVSTRALSVSRTCAAPRLNISQQQQQWSVGLDLDVVARRRKAAYGGVRWKSEDSDAGSKIWSFDEIQHLTSNPTARAEITLIDTREPSELASEGRIPGALNVPVASQPDSFVVPADEFEDRYGFERPPPDRELVFYCKAGVRSRAAAGIAREAGWKRVGEYPGSWVDWVGKGGAVER